MQATDARLNTAKCKSVTWKSERRSSWSNAIVTFRSCIVPRASQSPALAAQCTRPAPHGQ